MDYFEIRTDTRIHNAVQIQGDIITGLVFVDYIQIKNYCDIKHVFSEKVKSVFEMYDSAIQLKPYELPGSEKAYWITECREQIIVPEEENINKEYLKKCSKEKPILQLKKNNRSYFFVKLSVAESLLRRLPIGMRLYKLRESD